MKKKDNKGRVLKAGENQRKDGIYQYRYKDIHGKNQYAYASNLSELREKEKTIQQDLDKGIDYTKGKMSLLELVERYVSLKENVRYNTKVGYNFVLNILKEEPFAKRSIKDIKVSDVQLWVKKLSNDGRGYSTLTSIRGVVKPAFQMAVNDDIIVKNPFEFKLTEVVTNDSQKRQALTDAQRDTWMEFIRTDPTYCKYYDEFIVLLHTGMRVSEFCGLTFNDIDFEGRTIRVDHQLIRERGGRYYAETTKTESGRRYIYMDDEVLASMRNIIASRPKVDIEMVIDGFSGFIMLDKNKRPKVALHIENEFRWAMKKFKKLHPDILLPPITPHVFRHTYCTNMYDKGISTKSLQYLMGHSEVRTTMNIYTHAGYEQAKREVTRILQFKGNNYQESNARAAL